MARIAGSVKSKHRLPAKIRLLIREAIAAATMENCGVSEKTKNELRSYNQTWIIRRLDEVMAWDEGEEEY